MSTNPNNSVGTNGAFGGRTSVNAFNDIMGAFQSRGVLSGWGIVPSSGMTVSVGGSGTTRDVAIAEDASGNKTSVNNISGAPISVTLDSAPASNSRYDAIVAYVDKPPVGNATQDNPECCGIIPVTGTAASTPAYPDDAAVRSAITADGASGSTAYYAVLGYVLVASGTTTITSAMILSGGYAALGTNQIASNAVTSDKIDWATLNTGTITPASGYTLGSFGAVRVANIVVFQGSFQIPLINNLNNQTTAFTLPTGWRPSVTGNFPVFAFANAGIPARIRVGSDGTIKVSSVSDPLPADAYLQVGGVVYTV